MANKCVDSAPESTFVRGSQSLGSLRSQPRHVPGGEGQLWACRGAAHRGADRALLQRKSSGLGEAHGRWTHHCWRASRQKPRSCFQRWFVLVWEWSNFQAS